MTSNPIFLHSLFRAGSTYFFDVFRRSSGGYWCYQEPLNEYLIHAIDNNSQKLLDIHQGTMEYLRHPSLDQPYFYEFYVMFDYVKKHFRKEFSYDQYFCSSDAQLQPLKEYLEALIEHSLGIPFLQCCRTSGRISFIKSHIGGTHIFLWRNPWDQWWSYRLGFDTNNLLILNSRDLPDYLKIFKKEICIPEFYDKDIFNEYSFYDKNWLSAEKSYKLFYLLWCHAALEGLPKCDFDISIDQLSYSSEYRFEIYNKFENNNINCKLINLENCKVPQGVYGINDRNFFMPIENEVHELLCEFGYLQSDIERLQSMNFQFSFNSEEKASMGSLNTRDAMRARSLALQLTTKRSLDQQSLWKLENDIRESQQRQQSLELTLQESQQRQQSLELTLQESQQRQQSLELTLQESQQRQQSLELTLQESQQQREHIELMFHDLINSRSIRVTVPLRFVGHQVRNVRDITKKYFFLIKNFVKPRLKKRLIQLSRWILDIPLLKQLLIKLLSCFPNLKSRLKLLILRDSSSRLSASISVSRSNESNELEPLTAHALQIYKDLKSAILNKQNKQ